MIKNPHPVPGRQAEPPAHSGVERRAPGEEKNPSVVPTCEKKAFFMNNTLDNSKTKGVLETFLLFVPYQLPWVQKMETDPY